MTTTLHPAPVSIRQFTWNADAKILSAEMSEIRGLGRVYPDSCDEGFTVVGKTGREVVMVLQHEEIDRREGEIKWWDFLPAQPADRALVAGARIWND